MEIALYSNDPELHGVCLEIVRLTPSGKCTVKPSLRTPAESPSEIAIYDTTLGPLENLPEDVHARVSILVVDRAELPEVRKKALHFRSIVLLKPINQARLEMAIEQSMSRPHGGVEHDLMRLNGDALLEGLLYANFRLQQYDDNRSHFLARAVHELRAPLTSLNGYCGLFLDHKLGQLSAEQVVVLTRMRRSVHRLSRTVSAMLDLSIGRSSAYTPNYQEDNIIGCLEQALDEAGPALRNRRIELDVNCAPPGAPLLFDRRQMEQVFLNLLDNSCKFTSRGGFVRVAGYPYFWERRRLKTNGLYPGDRRKTAPDDREPNAYRIDISDNGPGISPERVDSLFTEYSIYGGGNDRSGAGLALAVCRLILRQHNGTVWAESYSHEGVCFCVVLPYSTVCTPVTQSGGDAAIA